MIIVAVSKIILKGENKLNKKHSQNQNVNLVIEKVFLNENSKINSSLHP